MTPAPRRGGAGAGRGQPFVQLFSGRRVLVVVFNELRSIKLDPVAAPKSAGGVLENHDRRGLSMRTFGVSVALVRGSSKRLRSIAACHMATYSAG